MDLTAPISYNSFSINTVSRAAGGAPMSGYLVDEVNVSQEDVRAYIDQRALQDGIDASDVYLGVRRVEAIVSVFGSTKGDFWDKAQSLLQHFSPTVAYAADTANLGFLPFDFFQPTALISTWPTSTYPNGIPLRFYLRPSGVPAYTSRRDDQGGASGKGIAKQFRIPLIARDPRKYAQTAQAVSISTATSPNVTHRGDYPTLPVITMTITSAGSSAFTLFVDGTSVNINFATVTSGVFSLDYSTRQLTDANDTSYQSLVTGNFTPIRAGGVQIYVTTMTGLSSVVANYREAWA